MPVAELENGSCPDDSSSDKMTIATSVLEVAGY